ILMQQIDLARESIRLDWEKLALENLTFDQRKVIREDIQICISALKDLRGPRIIATDRQAPRVYPRMIPLCSRFDSVLFTPKMSAIASYGNFSRSPYAQDLGNFPKGQVRTLPEIAIWVNRLGEL